MKVVHCKKDRYDVYIGRPSKWGNPYTHLPSKTLASYVVANRDEAIAKYKDYLYESGLIADIHELQGKTLGCWCAPRSCHGDVLIQLANGEDLTLTSHIKDA